MYCPKCGKKMNDSAKFCGICGNRIAADTPIKMQPQSAAFSQTAPIDLKEHKSTPVHEQQQKQKNPAKTANTDSTTGGSNQKIRLRSALFLRISSAICFITMALFVFLPTYTPSDPNHSLFQSLCGSGKADFSLYYFFKELPAFLADYNQNLYRLFSSIRSLSILAAGLLIFFAAACILCAVLCLVSKRASGAMFFLFPRIISVIALIAFVLIACVFTYPVICVARLWVLIPIAASFGAFLQCRWLSQLADGAEV